MKRLWNSLIALALSIPIALVFVAAAPAQQSGDSGIYTTRLKNGLLVIVAEDRSAPVVQSSVWYHFGSLDETIGKTGLAHALEHMSFRGSEHVSSAGLDDVTARLGAQMNGDTTYDYTQFYFVMPKDKLDVALYLDADRMQHLLLRQSDWNVERGAVLAEIDGDYSSPFYALLAKVRAAAYPGQPNGRTPAGVPADVAAATAADIAAYYRAWYAPNNAALVVAGDVDHRVVFEKAEKYFGAIPSKTLPARPGDHPVAARGEEVDAGFPFPFEVLDLAYAIPGDTEPGEPAMSTLATLIPNQRGPFYQALVQSNIALAIEANADTQLHGGLLNVFIVLNPGHTAAQARSVYQNVMDQTLASGFNPDLVTAAKQLTLADRTFSADSIDGIGDLAGYTYGIVGERISDEDARLHALTGDDLLATARKYLAQPTVVGHMRPNDSPPKGSSEKSDAAANDDFSKRVPQGPIVEPDWIRAAVAQPTTARSVLAPVSFTLSNGLRVIVQEKHDRPTFELRGDIAVSPAFAPVGKDGIISLASDVSDYGSANYPYAQRRKVIDDLGASVDAGQTFSARGLSRDFETILSVVADGERAPAFSEPWLSVERSQLANSLAEQATISGVMIDRAYDRLLMNDTDPSLRHATSASVSGISQEDLAAFARRYWRPDLTTITVVGDVTPERVRAAMETAFGSWQAEGPKPDVRLPALPPDSGGRDYIGTDSSQVYVRLGQPAIGRSDKDYDALLVLDQILGASGAFESRLWQELRQTRGLVYSVDTSVDADPDRGDYRIELSAAPRNVIPAINLVRAELKRLQTQPVSETELAEAKVRLVSSALLDEASIDGQAQQLMDIGLNHLPLDYYATLNERFGNVTAADVQRVAQRYLRPNNLIEVYSGPQGPWSRQPL
jgi:zinc protease